MDKQNKIFGLVIYLRDFYENNYIDVDEYKDFSETSKLSDEDNSNI